MEAMSAYTDKVQGKKKCLYISWEIALHNILIWTFFTS